MQDLSYALIISVCFNILEHSLLKDVKSMYLKH